MLLAIFADMRAFFMKLVLVLVIVLRGIYSFGIIQSKMADATNYKVDTTISTFKWHASKGLSSHNGYVQCMKGLINMEDSLLTGAFITIDMNSISNTDLSGSSRKTLVNHLKSDDYFNVEEYKIATLKIKTAKVISRNLDNSKNYEIVADLTIKGITKEIIFKASVELKANKIYVEASLDIDSTKYGIGHTSKINLNKKANSIKSNTFNLKVSIVANKKD